MIPEAADDALFLFSAVALAGFGFGATLHPRLKPLSLGARLGLAYGLGALLLTVEGLLFSLVRIPWTILTLGLPLTLISIGLGLVFQGHNLKTAAWLKGFSAPAFIVSITATVSLALLFAVSAATSVDLLFFYGVKAVRFAIARGIDFTLLKNPFFFHGVPEYPPLMSIVEAWGALFAGRLPWRVAPMVSWIWFAAAVLLLQSILCRRIPARSAAAVTAFWAAALSLSLAYSYSGGNGEAPLLFYETVAGVFLLTESPEVGRDWMAAAALAGATLSKQEGWIAGILFAVGVVLRDFREGLIRVGRRAIALVLASGLALGIWFGFQFLSGLRVGFRLQTRLGSISFAQLGTVLRESVTSLNAGSVGFAWMFPILILILCGRQIRFALPALALTGGVLAALFWTYLGGSAVDPSVMIRRTLPRASQPALSMLILGAAVAWFSRSSEPSVPSGRLRAGISEPRVSLKEEDFRLSRHSIQSPGGAQPPNRHGVRYKTGPN